MNPCLSRPSCSESRDRDSCGLETLAYYYVTWAKVFPDKLDMIGLPYKKAYNSAVAMLESLSGGG